ncbi:fibroblast growth factor receptor homolog 1-like isoform X2 [Contarinia nasturtii]|uniref:fibroblast growth factor receptor homolog 1-like isoform X2 n=1 Tax=Contarinia nasturtii TaxID=265458 RepID=UPI0012D3FC66|nr:fibroblast growth factor receptor homolog 1-like isoform X2 [Contarinia nasturtii]
MKTANMNVSIVIVLSSIFNLLSCAKLGRIQQPSHAMPTTSMEFISSSTDGNGTDFYTNGSTNNENDGNVIQTQYQNKGELPYFTNPAILSTHIRRNITGTVKFRCPAAGNPTPNITWTKDSIEIKNTAKLTKMKNKWAIFLNELTLSDTGVYVCKICNVHGCIEHATQLDVQDHDIHDLVPAEATRNDELLSKPDEIYSQIRSRSIAMKQNLTKESNGQLAVVSTFTQNTQSNSDETHSKESNDDENQFTTGFDTTESDMEELHNENQENDEFSEMDVDLKNGEAPYFPKKTTLLKFLPKPSGNMARIRCIGAGNPTPNITWTKNNEEIVRHMGTVQYKKWAIILEDLTTKDAGDYTCKLCNIHGCIDHTTKLLVEDRVKHKPILSEILQNATVLVDTTHKFRCEFISHSHVGVQWIRADCQNCSKNATIIEVDEDKSEELVLHNITHADEGWYTCIAANSLGHTTASAYLHVVDELEDGKRLIAGHKLNSLLSYIIIVSMGALFLIAIFIMLIGFKKLKREKLEKHRAMETVHQWTKKVIIVKPNQDEVDGSDGLQIPVIQIEKHRTAVYCNDPSLMNEYEFPLDANWEFPRNHLKFGPTLGEGAFGRVVLAEAYGLEKPQQTQIVAVKMVKEGHTDSDIAGLVREMEVMKMIGKHINVINLLGCCSQEGPLYVIVEYAPHGNLKDFLKKNLAMADYNLLNSQHVLTQKELTSFAYQVARGMEYLASRRYIHRDLAARNVLVCENNIVKIADFGLARDVQETDYYRKCSNGRLPIKWMAPESLKDRFYDSQSDVWSYGILLWEIMTFGEQPYPNILYSSVELLEYLERGIRMDKPAHCHIDIYKLMRQCWNWKPRLRPTFTEIVLYLDNILTTSSNQEYLNVINGPYIDDSAPNSDGDDQDVTDGFRGPPVCRPFLRYN